MNELSNKVEVAILKVNDIKRDMVQSGNEIAKIVYSISDELNERNACRDFALKTGMSKASISKMVYAEGARKELSICDYVSYNSIYKLKDIMCNNVACMLNEGMTEQEIRSTLTDNTDTETDTDTEDTVETDIEVEDTETAEPETDTEESRKDIVNQIWDVLGNYDIEPDDKKLLKMLIKGLR